MCLLTTTLYNLISKPCTDNIFCDNQVDNIFFIYETPYVNQSIGSSRLLYVKKLQLIYIYFVIILFITYPKHIKKNKESQHGFTEGKLHLQQ